MVTTRIDIYLSAS